MTALALGVLTVLWLAGTLVPLVWWLRQRRRPDLWTSLPLPAAVLNSTGTPTATGGPHSPSDLTVDLALPAPGRTARSRSRDGSPVALTGLPGGALALALPADPVRERRDHLLADLGGRLAHDLNTPLAAVLGHLDLVAHEPISEQARNSITVCQAEIARAHTLAGDLLALTRLRAGTARRAHEHAGAIAEGAASALLPLADQLDAELVVETPSDRVLVDVVADDLLRALRNLLTNALQHGLGERRRVRLCVDADSTSVTFRVQDSGPGLAPDELVRLSEPMVRGQTQAIGSGLGLAIATEVVGAHGGELTSGRNGAWAELRFTLPRTP